MKKIYQVVETIYKVKGGLRTAVANLDNYINTQEGLIYQTTPGLEVPIDTEIFLTITAGSSAAGTGYLFIEYTPQVA